jgi:adenylate cyclase
LSYDLEKKQGQIDLMTKEKELQDLNLRQQRLIRNALIVFLVLVLIITVGAIRNYLNKVKINKILDKQKDEIESLLLNILPARIARELQVSGYAKPRNYEQVTVLFTDFKDFTKISSGMTPADLVEELNTFFNAFDNIIDKHNLEKIKTIGDAYMCAGGIPNPNTTHPFDAIRAGLDMQEFMESFNQQRLRDGKTPWNLRIGIHTGPVVAGVVGKKKYAYDIWGSAVNLASRMESNGEAGKVNISAITFNLVKDKFECYYRGKIMAKNVGEVDMYFVGKEHHIKDSNSSPAMIESKTIN